MAGYLGTKAVLLSTTAADVIGNAEIGGSLTVGGNFTSTGIDDNATSTAITIDSSQNVGIGTSSPQGGGLHIVPSGSNTALFLSSPDGDTNTDEVNIGALNKVNTGWQPLNIKAYQTKFWSNGIERMRLDAIGNLLVGTTDASQAANTSGSGTVIGASGGLEVSRDSFAVAYFNKTSVADGNVIEIRKQGTTVGSIGNLVTTLYIETSGQGGLGFYSSSVSPRYNGSASDNFIDLGRASQRYDDVYATNGTIQTSDRNEKQDIEVLSDAEQRVAVTCKGLLRKFRWKGAVAEKGDDARIHFGIIAQDLQDAFAAEGLDAGRYAMFISSTWWETQTDVPAVEAVEAVYEDVTIPAVLDEDGNEVEPERVEQQLVTEAVEAKDAYTRTDTYETLEEAPEGAAERTRLGVRYPELLAFIIGAM